MVKLPGDAYFKGSDKESEILTFGKSKEQIIIDREKGISRFGGFLRVPNYAAAYLKSAMVLLENAKVNDELDELGLPIFYLARHAMEIKIKDLLFMAYDICEMKNQLHRRITGTCEVNISKKRYERLNRSHKIEELYNDLVETCKSLEVVLPVAIFTAVIDIIKNHEINPTWSRYNKSNGESHVDIEVAVPIVKLVDNLNLLFRSISFNRGCEEETLEMDLYYRFSHLTTELNE